MTKENNDLERELLHELVDFRDPDTRKILFEEYRLFVDSTEKAIARRQVVNNFFLTANTILLSALGVMTKQAFENTRALYMLIPLGIVGILLCVNWQGIIKNYRQLNAAKFKVIHSLESRLPAALFKAEWAALGKGEDSKKYKPISKTEERVAMVFMILYTAWICGAAVASLK
jgi:hypothetical protein